MKAPDAVGVIVSSALFPISAYFAVTGHEGARNLLVFAACISAIAEIGAMAIKKPVPDGWKHLLPVTCYTATVWFLVYFGMWFPAITMVVALVFNGMRPSEFED